MLHARDDRRASPKLSGQHLSVKQQEGGGVNNVGTTEVQSVDVVRWTC